MLRTYLYVPEKLEKKIERVVKAQNKSKAEVIRWALEEGIAGIQRRGAASANALISVSQLGKKFKVKGPKDSSEKIDEYLWGKNWSRNG